MSFRRILKSLFGISGHDEKTNDTHQELDIANATPTQPEVPCFEKKQEQSHTPTLIIQEPPVKKSVIIVQKDSATEELQEAYDNAVDAKKEWLLDKDKTEVTS